MKKFLILTCLLVLLGGCGTTIKSGETTLCPAIPYPTFTRQNNSTNDYIADKENLAIMGDNLNKLKTWAERTRNETITCYEKQVAKK